jgi:3-hydroxyanthranilate 3,4-dioxygenase
VSFVAPFNLRGWVEKHRDQLKPPVGNKPMWDNGGFLVMVVGGPNARTDYHVNPAEELFYQVEGDIVLKVIDDGGPRDVPIREGDIFLLPPKVPHSPQRPAGTIGVVVEYPRAKDEDHHLQWYCKGCGGLVNDFAFRPLDLGKQIKEMLGRFAADEALRTCKGCGQVYPV